MCELVHVKSGLLNRLCCVPLNVVLVLALNVVATTELCITASAAAPAQSGQLSTECLISTRRGHYVLDGYCTSVNYVSLS